jgi:hypothetical protein
MLFIIIFECFIFSQSIILKEFSTLFEEIIYHQLLLELHLKIFDCLIIHHRKVFISFNCFSVKLECLKLSINLLNSSFHTSLFKIQYSLFTNQLQAKQFLQLVQSVKKYQLKQSIQLVELYTLLQLFE